MSLVCFDDHTMLLRLTSVDMIQGASSTMHTVQQAFPPLWLQFLKAISMYLFSY